MTKDKRKHIFNDFFLEMSEIDARRRIKKMTVEWAKITNWDEYIGKYIETNGEKFNALAFLVSYLLENNYKCILSLGAGQCVLEYFLTKLIEDCTVTVLDMSAEYMEQVASFFPDLNPVAMKFEDDFSVIVPKRFDIAVFFGATQSLGKTGVAMTQYVSLMHRIRDELGVKVIIDFRTSDLDAEVHKAVVKGCEKLSVIPYASVYIFDFKKGEQK